ncbi:MAG: VTT domain-containing protein [Planctomycetes bacterium]|nr:VTT domain-containing protein [Planctomycetota bacterium]
MRLLGLILLVFMVMLASFLLLGGHRFFDPNETVAFFDRYRAWAVPIGFGLMIADLVLPVPSSAIMNWYGQTYGTVAGGLIGTAACLVSSAVAYWLSRLLGHRAAVRIAGQDDLDRTRSFFSRWGSFAVACARPVPMLAEAVCCLAGMSRMPFGRFLAASAVGSLPFALAFAYLGAVGRMKEEPLQFLALSFFIPMLLWIPVAIVLRRKTKSA